MDKQKQAMRNQREDAVLNRVLIWFGAAVVAEFLLLLLNRYYVNYTVKEIELAAALYHGLFVLQFVALAAAVACGAWLYMQLKQEKKWTLSCVLTMVSIAVAVSAACAYWFGTAGVQLLCTLVPAVAVMALIYYLYQKEFFVVTGLTAMGILGMWMVRKTSGVISPVIYGYALAVAVILVVAVALCRKLEKSGGVIQLVGKPVQIFPHGAGYGLIYLTCGLVAVSLALALVMGATLAYYLVFALVAWLFVMAVYYTVKLM